MPKNKKLKAEARELKSEPEVRSTVAHSPLCARGPERIILHGTQSGLTENGIRGYQG
jgi:hypothetical protein